MSSADVLINQQIFDYSIDLILVTDRQGNFLRISPSCRAVLGYEPTEMVGRSAIDFLYPPDLENTRAMMRAARINHVTRHFECRYVHKNGKIRLLIWTGVYVDAVERHFFIGRDITAARIDETFTEIAQIIAQMNTKVETIHQTLDEKTVKIMNEDDSASTITVDTNPA